MKKQKRPRSHKSYPSDVSDEAWSFVVLYLTLIRLDSAQREHDLRAVFNALRWLRAGCFEAMVHDLRGCCVSMRDARGSPVP